MKQFLNLNFKEKKLESNSSVQPINEPLPEIAVVKNKEKPNFIKRRMSVGSTPKSKQSIGTSPMKFERLSPEYDNFNAYFKNEKLKLMGTNKMSITPIKSRVFDVNELPKASLKGRPRFPKIGIHSKRLSKVYQLIQIKNKMNEDARRSRKRGIGGNKTKENSLNGRSMMDLLTKNL